MLEISCWWIVFTDTTICKKRLKSRSLIHPAICLHVDSSCPWDSPSHLSPQVIVEIGVIVEKGLIVEIGVIVEKGLIVEIGVIVEISYWWSVSHCGVIMAIGDIVEISCWWSVFKSPKVSV